MKPDRIIVGTDNPRTSELLRALYAPRLTATMNGDSDGCPLR